MGNCCTHNYDSYDEGEAASIELLLLLLVGVVYTTQTLARVDQNQLWLRGYGIRYRTPRQ
jgi:hypothetical protein